MQVSRMTVQAWGSVVVALLSVAHDAEVLDCMERRSGDLGCMAWTYESSLEALVLVTSGEKLEQIPYWKHDPMSWRILQKIEGHLLQRTEGRLLLGLLGRR